MGIRHSYSPPAFPVMKALVALGLVVTTIGIMLFANDMVSPHSPSVYLQLAVAGAVILCMSYLSIQVFRGLENV